jgi:hypothetical protein
MRQPENQAPGLDVDFDLTLLETISAGRYRFRIPTNTPEFWRETDGCGESSRSLRFSAAPSEQLSPLTGHID